MSLGIISRPDSCISVRVQVCTTFAYTSHSSLDMDIHCFERRNAAVVKDRDLEEGFQSYIKLS